jgi:hypothetical protein
MYRMILISDRAEAAVSVIAVSAKTGHRAPCA